MVAAPVVRSMLYRPVMPPTVSTANPEPDATALLVATLTPAGMSKPFEAEKSNGLPPKVMLIGTVWVPLLGGFWIRS